MHAIHYARKMSLPDYPDFAEEAHADHSRQGPGKPAGTTLQKLLPVLFAGCVLGLVILNAHHAPVTDKEELTLLQSMAVSDENAQLQLGLAYRDGRLGLKQDPVQADYWLQRSATGGNPYARQLLGEQPHDNGVASFGKEVARLLPPQQDIDHLKALAESGDSIAEFELAMRYRDGSWGVKPSAALFREWLEKSAAAGNPVAQQELNRITTHAESTS